MLFGKRNRKCELCHFAAFNVDSLAQFLQILSFSLLLKRRCPPSGSGRAAGGSMLLKRLTSLGNNSPILLIESCILESVLYL